MTVNSHYDGETLDLLAAVVARMDCPLMKKVGFSSLYKLYHPWQKAALLQEASVIQTATPAKLEDALQDDTSNTVFIPAYSIPITLVEKIVARYDITKAIFIEMPS